MELTTMTKLQMLADDIRALSKQTRESVIAIGEKLIEAKKIVGHGNFLPWIEAEFGWAERTAQNFMEVAKAASKSAKFADLDVPISALYLLAAPNTPEEAIEVVAARVEGGEKLSINDVKAEIKTAKPKANKVEVIAKAHRAKTGEWLSRETLAKKAGVNPRSADNALRAVKAFEAGQNSTEKMISVHVLIEELHPLFQRVLAQSRMHDARISKGELAMIAGKGQRLLDEWASDDPNVRRLRGRVVPLKQSAKERVSDVSSLESPQ